MGQEGIIALRAYCWRLFAYIALLLSFLVPFSSAHAGDAAQAKGLAWLQGQVLASGKIANKSRFGTPTQAQCEIAHPSSTPNAISC